MPAFCRSDPGWKTDAKDYRAGRGITFPPSHTIRHTLVLGGFKLIVENFWFKGRLTLVLRTILGGLPDVPGDSRTFARVLYLIKRVSNFAKLQLLIFSDIAVGL